MGTSGYFNNGKYHHGHYLVDGLVVQFVGHEVIFRQFRDISFTEWGMDRLHPFGGWLV